MKEIALVYCTKCTAKTEKNKHLKELWKLEVIKINSKNLICYYF